ncbi:flagellar hook-length control protein FliK [Clostridium chromiireducens]|uniref:Flagellar hook-length control protein FliK n=1 Tax=Clostridium chromiireducens TaxID=225345 RepID=A0A964W0W3_9CLOT|nr:flagellar hook-length control protein FliK [Clostridium chromiireducens]MVX62530.1 flagellar hook-length control protein FliK [Clostridium chromiireducens]
MIVNTKSSADNLLKSFDTSSNNKSISEFYKVDSKKNIYSSSDFKKVLSSRSNQQGQNKNIDNSNSKKSIGQVNDTDTDRVVDDKEKLEELEKESESSSKEKASDILTELLNLLTRLGIKKEDLKLNGNINTNDLKALIGSIDNKSSNGMSNIMEKIMELLKDDSVKDKLDANSLKTMEKILGNLSAKLGDSDINSTKGIKSLMSEISNIINGRENNDNKILNIQDVLGKNYSQENSESSTNSNNSETSKGNSNRISKEEKFLNSLVGDNKDDSLNKINLFGTRTSTIQNQGADNVRGLTINKATFADDLVKDVKFMSNNSLKELIVKVNPGNLGEITIKLVQEDGLMKANLKVNSKETAALLTQNLNDIKKQLGEQNLRITDINIELYQDDTTFFRGQGFGGQLSEEQERRNSNSNDSVSGINNVSISEEEMVENTIDNDSNLDFFV